MEVVDVVIEEALNDKEIKRLLSQAKLKTNNTTNSNNSNNISHNISNDISHNSNDNDSIIDLSSSVSPQSSSVSPQSLSASPPHSSSPIVLVLPQYSSSEPLDLQDKKSKKPKKHMMMTDPSGVRHVKDSNDNDFSKTHSIDKYGRFSSYNSSNNDIDEIDNIINSNNISTASTNDWSRPLGQSFKQPNDYSNDFDYDDNDITNKSIESINNISLNKHRHIRFDDNLVSDVFTREKYSRDEIPELFYTHEEACKFTADYNKECYRAQIEGYSWYDWWQTRETGLDDFDDYLEISDDFVIEEDEQEIEESIET